MLMWQEPLSGIKLDVGQVLHPYTYSYLDFLVSICRIPGRRDLSPPPTPLRIAYNYKPQLVKETQDCYTIFLSVSSVQLSKNSSRACRMWHHFQDIHFFKVKVFVAGRGL